jgi:peptide chain release factor
MSEYVKQQATANSKKIFEVEILEASKDNCYHSITLGMQDDDLSFFKKLEGVIQWTCKSSHRPNHKRKNWFIEIHICEITNVDADLRPQDVVITTYRTAVGNGGQHINKTDSAVRIVHTPTGIIVECTQERSQHQNREIGLARLRKKLNDLKQQVSKQNQKDRWGNHNTLERGNPIMIFECKEFRRVV